ncbi:MAG: tRNA uracil 4-sulfurtransferase ThiI [Candidatus Magasanikbacteria bacterium]|jgi:thiamine biosynthesis protein ThiI
MNYILHVDEIFLKGNNQPFFYRALISNLLNTFAGVEVKRIEGGVWLKNLSENDLDILKCFPGVANFALAEKCETGIENIKIAVDKLLVGDEYRTFRVSANRSDKKYPLTSGEIERAIGQYIGEKYHWKVDLKKFDQEININVGSDGAIVYGNLIEGAGGLPVGTTGKVLCLLSGGIDSPVAAYEMMKRGAEVAFVHFMNQTAVSESVGEKIFDLVRLLARFQGRSRLFVVPFADLQKEVVMKVPSGYRMIINRRLFLRIAEKIAQNEKCLALVTGDSLGQVASQTLENMSAIQSASAMLKLSPLVGTNKREIINRARAIKTLDISHRPYEDCCSLFVAKHPETKAKPLVIEKIEQNLDFTRLDKIQPISYYISSN